MPVRGVYAAVVTPTDADGTIQTDTYGRHARWLLANGCHGLGVFGTTSETNCYTVDERKKALEAYITGGLPADAMILGVGCCARGDTVSLIEHARGLGVKRVLALPPFFYKNNSDEGLFRAFAEVIDRVAGGGALEFYLYHFPQVSGVPVTKPVIERLLADYPGIVAGLKDSSGDWQHTYDLIESFPGFAVFSGADNHLAHNIRAGGAGVFSAAGNIICRINREVFDALEGGDDARADALMETVSSLRAAVSSYPLIPAIKAAMIEAFPQEPWKHVRPPLMPLDAARAAELRARLEEIGLDYPGSS